MKKLILQFLHFIGFVDCVHDYSNWNREIGTEVENGKEYRVYTGRQVRTCEHCKYTDKRWV